MISSAALPVHFNDGEKSLTFNVPVLKNYMRHMPGNIELVCIILEQKKQKDNNINVL